MSNDPKYPHIEVRLSGADGNAFSILGTVRRAMQDNLSREEFKSAWGEFEKEATSGDYDNLLATVFRWVDVV